MKTFAKVLIIISMILCFWTIITPIIGGIALAKMKNGELPVLWKVLVLIFVNFLAGILLFFVKE